MSFEDDHLDVLQNIEFAIVTTFRKDPSVLDLDVHDAVSALVRHYEAEEQQFRPPQVPLGNRPQRIFDAVRNVCEWRLGRASALSAPGGEPLESPPSTLAEIIACLKRIRKSVQRWTKVGGRQGYLSFVSQYVI
jgi:hypothetical protein